MCVFLNPQFKLIQLESAEIPLNIILFLGVNSEISKGRGLLATGDDVQIGLCGYSVYHEDELQ